jgi:crotonobetaine/carnitine-CoA ligase
VIDTVIEVDPNRTLGSELERAAEADPDRLLVRFETGDVSPGRLETRSRAAAGALQAWGIVRGDRVAVMMGNVPEFLEAWFGIARLGAVEVPVHSAYKGPLLEHVLGESQSSTLFCDAEFVPRLRGLDLPELRRLIVRGEAEPPAGVEMHRFEDVLADAPVARLPALDGDAISCILYTSGTTGPSKGVVLTHSANLHLANSATEFCSWTAADTLYTAFPLFHVNAKYTSVVAAIKTGAKLVIDERFSASRFWERMRTERVTSFNAMGAMISMISAQPPRDDDRHHDVRRTYSAATPTPLWEPFERRFGVEVLEHYGMTEIGIAIWNREHRVGSIGRPAPWFEVRLADERDRAVTTGDEGEIQVRPNLPGIVPVEYWKRPDATAEAFRNLWFHTGDRARADDDGFLYYVDRIKDCIRRRGENISSWELESVISERDDVLEVAAYGVPSELGEDEVMIAVVVAPGRSLDLEALFAHCERRVARFAVPRYVRLVDELPKTPSQRVQKFALREVGVTDDTFDRSAVTLEKAGP